MECALGTTYLPDVTCSEKRRLIIPANLGYGMRGAGGVIPGGWSISLLISCRSDDCVRCGDAVYQLILSILKFIGALSCLLREVSFFSLVEE